MSETIYFDTSKIGDSISKSMILDTNNFGCNEINEEIYELYN